jgi:hypothetical protein
MATDNAKRMQQTDDAWNGRDWDAFDRLHDPECVVYWPGREADPTHGGQDHRAEAIAFCDAFPDNKVKNQPYDVLFVRVTSRASSHGSLARSLPRWSSLTAVWSSPRASHSTCFTPPQLSGATAGSSRSTSSLTTGRS